MSRLRPPQGGYEQPGDQLLSEIALVATEFVEDEIVDGEEMVAFDLQAYLNFLHTRGITVTWTPDGRSVTFTIVSG